MKTPVMESLFLESLFSFIKKVTPVRCFPENIAKFLRTSILKNNCERLLQQQQATSTFQNTVTKERCK